MKGTSALLVFSSVLLCGWSLPTGDSIAPADEQPKITYSKETFADAGEDILLDCAVEGVDLSGVANFGVSWSKIDEEKPTNSYPIAAGDSVLLFTEKYTVVHPENTYQFSLKITNINEDDSGLYRCTVNFGEEQKINADVPVHIRKAAYFNDNLTKTLTVTEGDSISIDCQPGGYPKPEVYWERVGQELPLYGGKLFKANQFDIPHVERSHKGQYVCYGDNGIGTPAVSELHIEVQYRPDITFNVPEVYSLIKEPAELSCIVQSYPKADVVWYKDDIAILGSANMKVTAKEMEEDKVESTLHISELSADDLGKYKCKAQNIVGERENFAYVTLKSPPLIYKRERTEILFDAISTPQGRSDLPVVLPCTADGSPKPQFRWEKDGKPLPVDIDSRLTLVEDTGSLAISDPILSDKGTYQCFAYNELGTAVGEPIMLQNITNISFNHTGSEENEVEAEIGKPFKMSCPPVEGYPKPQLRWAISYPPDEENTQFKMEFVDTERQVVDPEGNLWFTHITKEDESTNFQYMCLGVSDFRPLDYSLGSVVKLRTILPTDGIDNVEEDYINVEAFAMYTSEPKQEFQAGETNRLWCIFGGEPSPLVQWRRTDGNEINSERVVEENFHKSLVFNDVQLDDAGEYECVAVNGVGDYKSHKMLVNVIQKPVFKSDIASQTIEEGGTVSFVCDVVATGELSYNWFFNGRPLNPGPGSNKIMEGNKLTVKRVTVTDIGNYACNASNEIGHAYGQTILNVIPSHYAFQSDLNQDSIIYDEINQLKLAVKDLQLAFNSEIKENSKNTLNLLEKIYAEIIQKNVPEIPVLPQEEAAITRADEPEAVPVDEEAPVSADQPEKPLEPEEVAPLEDIPVDEKAAEEQTAPVEDAPVEETPDEVETAPAEDEPVEEKLVETETEEPVQADEVPAEEPETPEAGEELA